MTRFRDALRICELLFVRDAHPADADTLYIHDLALLPSAFGGGHARIIIDRLTKAARDAGFARLALVAVNASTPFWATRGFAPAAESDVMRAKLATYGDDARYMARKL